MSITIYRYANVLDLNGKFKELFEESDILFVEKAYREDHSMMENYLNELYEKVYSIYLPPYPPENPEYGEKLESFIRNSKKQIKVEKSPLSIEEAKPFENLWFKVFERFIDGNLNEACKKISIKKSD